MNAGEIYVVRTNLTNPPKDKIVLCICGQADLFFWFNTDPRRHGIGQMAFSGTEHGALSRACYLDCSRVTTFSPQELAAAQARGPVTQAVGAAIKAFLNATPPRTLPQTHLALALVNLP